MLQDITRTIPAGQPSIFNVAGASLACIAADLPDFQIRFGNDPEATFRVGFEYTPPEGFDRFEVRNTRSAPLTVTFTVAEGQFRDRRQISSAPQSFEPVTLEDLQDTGFVGGTVAIGTAVNVPRIGFHNPPNSGVTAVIRRMWFQMSLPGGFVTLVPVSPALGGGAGALAGLVPSSFAGGEPAKTEMWFGNIPSLPSVFGGGTRFVLHTDNAGLTRDLILSAPIILPEASTLSVVGSIPGLTSLLYVNAEVLEFPAG